MESIHSIRTLKTPLENLASLGRRKPLFHRLMGQCIGQALFHLPINIQTWREVSHIHHSQQGENVRLQVTVQHHEPNSRFGKPYKIYCHDGRNQLEVIYFNAKRPVLEKILPQGRQRILFGKADYYHGTWSIVHPDKVLPSEGRIVSSDHQPVYPLTAGITNNCVQRIFTQLLPKVPILPEWLDPHDIHRVGWPSWNQAIVQVHNPTTKSDLTLSNSARQRLAYDELLSHQLALHLARSHSSQSDKAPILQGKGKLTDNLLNLLPFSLTAAQQNAIDDIFADMQSSKPMARLVQGDVGSGKTLVAFMAMLRAIETGYQAALLAPTDILARQHFDTINPLCHQLGIHVALLTGRDKGKSRKYILDQIANHNISLIIGTHALIQDDVCYAKLGLAIVDEQHRFGVQQRLALGEKGKHVHMLAMTATPIPRTMILAHYGDMTVSLIKEKPVGRLPIQTKIMSMKRQDDVIDGVRRALKEGAKIFWVCPLVEDSEALDISAVEGRSQDLEKYFGPQVGLIHGRMKSDAKDTVMNQFIHGDIHILVATTVIEVGVHVPQATIMIIEHAERFGLAQLHQLRGRIGRGHKAGTCLLLYGDHLSATGRQRLETMRQTSDGFKIAEVDLKLRGGGDILGIRQSGMPQFRLADFVDQSDLSSDLLDRANNEAREILRVDPFLTSPRGQALRCLLQLFDREEAIKYTRS